MKRPEFLAVAAMALSGCGGGGNPQPEAVSYGTYYVVNETSVPVAFEAVPNSSSESPIHFDIAPSQVVEVDRVAEGSGGHVFPSNFYESYVVRRDDGATARLFENADWAQCGTLVPDEEDRSELCLHVEESDFQ